MAGSSCSAWLRSAPGRSPRPSHARRPLPAGLVSVPAVARFRAWEQPRTSASAARIRRRPDPDHCGDVKSTPQLIHTEIDQYFTLAPNLSHWRHQYAQFRLQAHVGCRVHDYWRKYYRPLGLLWGWRRGRERRRLIIAMLERQLHGLPADKLQWHHAEYSLPDGELSALPNSSGGFGYVFFRDEY